MLLAGFVIHDVTGFMESSIHALEKFLCPEIVIAFLQEPSHHDVDTTDFSWFVVAHTMD